MDQRSDRAEWVARWQAAAPRLIEIRDEELTRVDVANFVRSMDDAFEAVRGSAPVSVSSGLVDQQRWFARLRK